MSLFNKVSKTAFENFQFNAGMVLKTFDPENPSASTNFADSNIVTATNGGINPKCTPNYIDLAEGVDNVPTNTKELKRIDYFDCSLGFTALDMTAEMLRLQIGAADIENKNTYSVITPRLELKESDFTDLWWVGDITGGGWGAIHLKRALSQDGASIQTAKKINGQLACNFMGHYTTNDLDDVPMEYYVGESAA